MLRSFALILLVLISMNFRIHAGQLSQTGQTSKRDTYYRLLDALFPHSEKSSNGDLQQYLLSLRFRPSFDPESQINIVKYYGGKIELILYTVSNGKGIWNQMVDLEESTERNDLDFFIKSISIERQVIQKSSKELKRLLDRFPGIRFSLPIDTNKVTIIDDGVGYDLWADAGTDKSSFTTNDSYPPGPYKFPIVKWMNDVLKATGFKEYEK